jgi:hypothetical protein
MAKTKVLSCLLAVGLLLAAGAAFSPAQAQAQPAIACDKPEHDFGQVAQGEDVEHIFKIKNKGKGVLKIERARGG